jgi:aryl-alcohol dehydrogenase-like predicted oxidoreductase
MEYRSMGRSDLVVSEIGLGCSPFGWLIDEATSKRVVDAAIDAGITLFDTANSYGGGNSERYLGAALGTRRSAVIVATKVGAPLGNDPGQRGASPRHIRQAVEDSLRRLKTDWIDLYQLHFPDPETPIGETLGVLDELVREGKIRYAGSSNFAAWQVADAAWTAATLHLNGFVAAQNEYSLISRGAEAELIPACRHYGVGLVAYLPLAGGLLTGRYPRGVEPGRDSRMQFLKKDRYLTEETYRIVDRLNVFAAERQTNLVGAALGGVLAQPGIASVIVGASRPEHVVTNVAALDWTPDVTDLAALDDIVPSRRRR